MQQKLHYRRWLPKTAECYPFICINSYLITLDIPYGYLWAQHGIYLIFLLAKIAVEVSALDAVRAVALITAIRRCPVAVIKMHRAF